MQPADKRVEEVEDGLPCDQRSIKEDSMNAKYKKNIPMNAKISHYKTTVRTRTISEEIRL